MDIKEFLEYVGGGLVMISVFVQISPIRINPWSWLAKQIGHAVNGEVIDKVNNISNVLNDHIKMDDERDAEMRRNRILHFNDELLHGVNHTKEHFDDILSDITKYERYCQNHPDFENNRTVLATKQITKIYNKCMDNNSFL